MSADNVIFCVLIDGLYWVWHDFASNDNPMPNEVKDKSFYYLKSAKKYAEKLMEEYEYVEYGICYSIDNLKEEKNIEQEAMKELVNKL